MDAGVGAVGCSEGLDASIGPDPEGKQGEEVLEAGDPPVEEGRVAEEEGPPAAAEGDFPLREIVIPISRSKCSWMDTGMGLPN